MLALKERTDNIKDIAYYTTDSRLTADPDGRHYDWVAMIERYKELGRKLTADTCKGYFLSLTGKSLIIHTTNFI